MPAADVPAWVTAHAGARPQDRDAVDTRLVQDVLEGTGRQITSQSQVGGFPILRKSHVVLTLPPSPNADDDGDGYTNLEEWLHGLAARIEGELTQAKTAPGAPQGLHEM